MFLTKVPLGALWSEGWFPRQNQFDLPTIVIGTLAIAFVAMVVAIPVGLGAAIYLAEYSDGRLRRILKPIIETLAGVPSVVMGFFALSVISPDFVKKLFSRRRHVQPDRRRHRRGHPDGAAGGVRRRGRDVRRPRRAP